MSKNSPVAENQRYDNDKITQYKIFFTSLIIITIISFLLTAWVEDQISLETLQSIQISTEDSVNGNIPTENRTHQFKAKGHFLDESIANITKQVAWSGDETLFSISNNAETNRLVTAAARGTAHLSATTNGMTDITTPFSACLILFLLLSQSKTK